MLEARNTWSPLPLRLMLGFGFLYHGLPKWSVQGHDRFVELLQGLGMPFPELTAWFVAGVETFGGALLMLGLLTRISSLFLIGEMVVAAITVHLPAGFNFMDLKMVTPQGPLFGTPGIEVNLLYIAGLLSLLISGPGALAVRAESSVLRQRRLRPRPA